MFLVDETGITFLLHQAFPAISPDINLPSPWEKWKTSEIFSIFRLQIYIFRLKICIFNLQICIFSLKIEIFSHPLKFLVGTLGSFVRGIMDFTSLL